MVIGAINAILESVWNQPVGSNPWGNAINNANKRIAKNRDKISYAKEQLLKFLALAEEYA